jgi:hypothetical protein
LAARIFSRACCRKAKGTLKNVAGDGLCRKQRSTRGAGKAALLSVGEQIDTRSAADRLVLNVLASARFVPIGLVITSGSTGSIGRRSSSVRRRVEESAFAAAYRDAVEWGRGRSRSATPASAKWQ